MLNESGSIEVAPILYANKVGNRGRVIHARSVADNYSDGGCVELRGEFFRRKCVRLVSRIGLQPRRAGERSIDVPHDLYRGVAEAEAIGTVYRKISLRSLDDRAVRQHSRVAHGASK